MQQFYNTVTATFDASVMDHASIIYL